MGSGYSFFSPLVIAIMDILKIKINITATMNSAPTLSFIAIVRPRFNSGCFGVLNKGYL